MLFDLGQRLTVSLLGSRAGEEGGAARLVIGVDVRARAGALEVGVVGNAAGRAGRSGVV